jgi:hypothetical protein
MIPFQCYKHLNAPAKTRLASEVSRGDGEIHLLPAEAFYAMLTEKR